jgi:hypothetical protein
VIRAHDHRLGRDVALKRVRLDPAGTRARGHVARARSSGKVSGRAELTLELDRLSLEDGQTLDVQARPLVLRARSGAKKNAGVVGALAGIGAVGGGIFGGT